MVWLILLVGRLKVMCLVCSLIIWGKCCSVRFIVCRLVSRVLLCVVVLWLSRVRVWLVSIGFMVEIGLLVRISLVCW